MVNHNLVRLVQAEVTSIFIRSPKRSYIKRKIYGSELRPKYVLKSTDQIVAKCDYVHMALGGSPRKPFELNGNPQIFNMFESLNHLNSEYVGEADLSGGNIYIVGE
eukprot:NODE_1790_length_590_cov_0.354379.p1 type:complete len:106 gc:universal NODE_1790_length_590_cov_0.354379:399-82(-)